jgi:hypothetical protein
MRCMTALAIIEDFHVCKHRRLRLLVRVKVLHIDQFGLLCEFRGSVCPEEYSHITDGWHLSLSERCGSVLFPASEF